MLLHQFLFLCLVKASFTTESKKPNFVVILTDDQDSVLGGMKPMKNVHQFIGKQGMTFTNSYTTSPICCPSRASFLTGQYVHNHQTYNNTINGGCYSERWRENEQSTFVNLMRNEGYETFYAGKYLNQYGAASAGGPERVPPGWSEWHGLVGNSRYYNYTLSNNGVPTFSADLYLTDVIRDLSLSFIEKQKQSDGSGAPFVAVLAPPAPHQPFTPAPRHSSLYANVTALRQPNFNVAVQDKHWLMSMPPTPLPESLLPELDRVYRSRWEALLAVDEMVADIVEALDTQSLLNDTYLIFTSDNGYHIGQFSQVYDKRQPYETDIKVPLLIRGPGIDKGVTNHQPVLNIDLAPTILDLAGIEVPGRMDGHPIAFGDDCVKERKMLVEYHGEGGNVQSDCPWIYDDVNLSECRVEYLCKCQDSRNNTFACLRHIGEKINMKYCYFLDSVNFTELYNLSIDQFEMRNIVNEVLPAVKHWYHLNLVNLLRCKGAAECDRPLESFGGYGIHHTYMGVKRV